MSTEGQLSVDALKANLAKVRKEFRTLKRGDFVDTDRVVALSKNVTTYQQRVAKGLLGAPPETAAELQAINSALTDVKTEALTHVGGAAAIVDRERVQQEARDAFLREILEVLEETLSPDCFSMATEALLEQFGEG